MWSKYDIENNSIQSYYQEIFQTFMLELYVFITRLLTLVYLKVITNIQFYPFTRKIYLLQKKWKGSLPTTMLKYSLIHNIYPYDVYIEDIPDMNYQLLRSNLEQCFIQKNNYQHLWYLCQHYRVSTSVDIYLLGNEKYPASNVI